MPQITYICTNGISMRYSLFKHLLNNISIVQHFKSLAAYRCCAKIKYTSTKGNRIEQSVFNLYDIIMAKSQATFMKKQLEKNRQKKKEEKLERKQERQQNSTGGDLESMMAYVNEFGEIVSTPPEKK